VAPVELGAVAFRYEPRGEVAAVDRMNMAILDRVNASGEAFMTHTSLNGRIALRAAIGNLKTRDEDAARLWELLREAAASVEGEVGG